MPADAVVTRVTVQEGRELELYNEWSGPDESRWILEGFRRERDAQGLPAYPGTTLVHVRVPSIPAHGAQHLQIAYTQPLRAEDGAITWPPPPPKLPAAAPKAKPAAAAAAARRSERRHHGARSCRAVTGSVGAPAPVSSPPR